ncbi:HPP family protein [Nannocystaceae bacterium ST9]
MQHEKTSTPKPWTRIARWWLPHPQRSTLAGKLITALGTFLGLLAVALISRAIVGRDDAPFIAAYMGAATVLIFGAPQSPLSQPWPLLAGHVLSALVGVACYRLIPDLVLASAAAVSLAILVMQLARCLHPPGGAAAMVAVLGGPSIHELGYAYAIVPVGLNALVLLGLALAINNAIPGRRYPALPEPGSG